MPVWITIYFMLSLPRIFTLLLRRGSLFLFRFNLRLFTRWCKTEKRRWNEEKKILISTKTTSQEPQLTTPRYPFARGITGITIFRAGNRRFPVWKDTRLKLEREVIIIKWQMVKIIIKRPERKGRLRGVAAAVTPRRLSCTLSQASLTCVIKQRPFSPSRYRSSCKCTFCVHSGV